MAFVVTAGQVQAVDTAPGPFSGGWTGPSYVTLSPTLTMTYEALWRAQPAIRTVVGFLARNVAQLGVDPYERLSATDRRKLTDHPLARILERPMPGSKWTKYRLLNQLIHDLCLFDSAHWLKLKLEGQVQAVVPIPRRLIKPTGKNWLQPEGYRIEGNSGHRDVGVDAVVHFHGYDPNDPRDGVPPIETLRQVLAEEHAASTYREQMWRNGARVAGYVSRPADAPKWSPEARSRFTNDWRAQYTGDGPDAGGTPLLEDGMTFNASGVTPKDAQYVEARKLTREEVAVAYHVQPVLLGLMDGANFSSVSEIHRWLYQDTLAPYLAQIAQDIENQLLLDLDPSAADGHIYVEFNLNEKLRGSFEQQAAAISSSVGGPWMTRDEARAMYNLGHIDGADELIIPLNVMTGGLASPRDTAPDNPDNGPSNGEPPAPKAHPAVDLADLFRGFYDRQCRVLASRAGAGKAASVERLFDGPRWDRELTRELAPLLPEPVAAQLAAKVNTATRAALAGVPAADDPVAAIKDVFAGRAAEQIALEET